MDTMLKPDIEPQVYFPKIGLNNHVLLFQKGQTIFTQGDKADSVFYILEGIVRLIVVAHSGKEATLGILEEKSFFGEGTLVGQPLRIETAHAMTDCRLLQVRKQAMLDAMYREHSFSDLFMSHLLKKNVKYEEELADHLFNNSEKRLAHILLSLAHYDERKIRDTVIPKISQEVLAEMVGTTRSRVSYFMNKFRKRGYIDYGGGMGSGLEIHNSLLNIILHG